MDTLSALREANLMSPRQGEWATLQEVNASGNMLDLEGTNITHSQLTKLVKADAAESAFIEGQTMYRASGQAAKPGGEGKGGRGYQPPEGDYPPGQDYPGEQDYPPDTRGGKDDYPNGKDDWWNYDQPKRGGEQTPTGAPAGGPGISIPVPMPDISQMM